MRALSHPRFSRPRGLSAIGTRHQRNQGMTLVELMVSLVIGLLISLAAVSSLIVTRQGFNTVDAASQVRDNGRFAADLIQRVSLQAGFKDPLYVIAPPSQKDQDDDALGLIAANVTGFGVTVNCTCALRIPANEMAASARLISGNAILFMDPPNKHRLRLRRFFYPACCCERR